MYVKIKNVLKKEIVLVIAVFLTIITCFIVPIDEKYIGYFDMKTLISLFCILSVVAGLKNTNIFELISEKIVKRFTTRRTVILSLIFGTFFFDTIVANDMSLIIFLPLTYLVLHSTNNDKFLGITFIMQTIAANMGGMITPYGNPQNLYLYSHYNIPTLEFVQILLPQSIMVAILLIICSLFIKNEPLIKLKENSNKNIDKKRLIIYTILFVLVILTIFRVIPYIITFLITLIIMLLFDEKRFKHIDYSLILTFITFFIFSGNISRIEEIKIFFENIANNNLLFAGLTSCQVISNVPTAIFLSKFTMNYTDLLIAVNIGSLGIMTSSLASLITLKEFLKHQPKKIWKYLLTFTIVNTIFLIILLFVTKMIY